MKRDLLDDLARARARSIREIRLFGSWDELATWGAARGLSAGDPEDVNGHTIHALMRPDRAVVGVIEERAEEVRVGLFVDGERARKSCP